MMEFSYAAKRGPVIPVILINGAIVKSVEALLDSGAMSSMISRDLANLLGISCTGNYERFTGFDGHEVICEESNVIVTIENNDEMFSEDIPIYIMENNDGDVLLGMDGVFLKLSVTFDASVRRIFLKRH